MLGCCFCGRQALRRRGLHTVVSGPVRVDIGDRGGGTGFCAFRVATTKIALDDLAGYLGIVDRSKWAGNRADLASYAFIIRNFLGAGNQVDTDRIDRAGAHAPGFVALGTGIGCKSTFIVEGKHLDKGS